MKFSDLFSGFGRDRTSANSQRGSENGAAAPVPEPGAIPAGAPAGETAAPAASAPAVPVGGAPVAKAPQSVEEIADLLGTINSVLASESRSTVRIPCAALLSVLPPELRGPAYRSDTFPHATLRLERTELLEQLKTGRVSYRLGDLYHEVPAGWVAPEKDAIVALDLAQVVGAIPPTLFQLTARQDPALQQLAAGRDLFMPKRAFVPESGSVEVSVPAPAPAVAEIPVEVSSPTPVTLPAVEPVVPEPAPPPQAPVVVAAAPEAEVQPHAPVLLADPAAQSVEAIADILGTINSVLSADSRHEVRIPCAALLAVLPAELRGPAYRSDGFPDASLLLDRAELLEQLRSGRVAYRLGELHDVPAGWVLPATDAIVTLDLAQVVAAIPPAMFQVTASQDPELQALAGGRDLFSPKRAFVPSPERAAAPAPVAEPVPAVLSAPVAVPISEPIEPEAVAPPPAAVAAVIPESELPLVAPVGSVEIPQVTAAVAPVPAETVPAAAISPPAPPPPVVEDVLPEEEILADEKRVAKIVVPRDVQPIGWDGIEHSLADAAAGVDINSAPAAALEALAGVGPSRAADIVAYREAHGAFKNIFELAKVPGIGASLFRQMTGLSLVNATARHEVLNRLLELEGQRNCSLAEMLTRLATRLGIQGCVLAGEYGMTLARTPGIGDEAENYAATATQLFRRSQRYLRSLVGDAVECLHLPLAKPELLLFAAENFTLVMVLGRKRLSQTELRKTVAVVRELAWLLGRRAVVTGAP